MPAETTHSLKLPPEATWAGPGERLGVAGSDAKGRLRMKISETARLGGSNLRTFRSDQQAFN